MSFYHSCADPRIVFTSRVTTRGDPYSKRMVVVASGARTLGSLALLGGALAAATGSWVGIGAMAAGFVGMLAADLAVGIVSYRRTMRAPWPTVAPVDVDEWD